MSDARRVTNDEWQGQTLAEAGYLSVYQLLKKYGIRAKKSLGQNFLADEHHLLKILAAADLNATDAVLEIGPGLGTLTALLASRVKQVIAVEVDAQMVKILQAELEAVSNVTLIQDDVLSLAPGDLFTAPLPKSYQVVANLPYYITSPIIQHLLEADFPPEKIIVTVQKEVAERIVAKPGALSILAIAVQFYGKPMLCHPIPATAFVPAPKVTSAVLRIDRHPTPPVSVSDLGQFFRVVKAGFSQKRKQLKNSLAAGLHCPQNEIIPLLTQVNIDPTRRAQTLTLAEWAALTNLIYPE